MNNSISATKLMLALIAMACSLASLSGCNANLEQARMEADDFAYNAIDSKWDNKFGLKTNINLDTKRPNDDPNLIAQLLPADGIMSLPNALTIATLNSREYQKEKEDLYSMALQLRLVRHLYEVNPFLDVAAGFAREERPISSSLELQVEGHYNTLPNGPPFLLDVPPELVQSGGDELNNVNKMGIESEVGFTKLLATGAWITASYAQGLTKIISGDAEGGLTDILNATIKQPLLRGSDRAIVMEKLTQAERNLLYQIRSFNRFRKEFVVTIVSQYYRVAQLDQNREDANLNYQSLKDIHNKMQGLASIGKIPTHEVEEAQQEKLEALDVFVKAEKEYRQALDEFKILLALNPTTEFDLSRNELLTLNTYPTEGLGIEEAQAIEAAMLNRLDLANVTDTVLDAERKVNVAADDIRMELNFVAMANDEGVQREGLGTLLGTVTAEDTYRLGVEMDIPLDRTDEKMVYRQSLILHEQAKRSQEELSDTVTLEVRNAYRDLSEAHNRHLVQSRSLELARKRLENTTKLLQYQRTNVRDVLRAQRDLFKAQEEGVDALVDFTVAALNFYRDTGTLRVQPDGSWNKPEPVKISQK